MKNTIVKKTVLAVLAVSAIGLSSVAMAGDGNYQTERAPLWPKMKSQPGSSVPKSGLGDSTISESQEGSYKFGGYGGSLEDRMNSSSPSENNSNESAREESKSDNSVTGHNNINPFQGEHRSTWHSYNETVIQAPMKYGDDALTVLHGHTPIIDAPKLVVTPKDKTEKIK